MDYTVVDTSTECTCTLFSSFGKNIQRQMPEGDQFNWNGIMFYILKKFSGEKSEFFQLYLFENTRIVSHLLLFFFYKFYTR